MTERRVGRNGRANSKTINTSTNHREVGDEIKQVKWLSFLPTIEVDNANYFNKIDIVDETQKALHSHSKLKKEALLFVNDEQLPVEKNMNSLNMAFERREYERRLMTHQQNFNIGEEEDYHDQTKSKLNPFISSHRASRRDDDRQQPNTYVAGERYNNSPVLSEQFRPIQTVGEEIVNDKTTDDNISLTRDMLRSIISSALEEQKKLLDVTTADAIKCAFSEGIKKGTGTAPGSDSNRLSSAY